MNTDQVTSLVARTDQRGRDLRTFLIAEIVGNNITVEELRQAVGVKRARWYGNGHRGRYESDDFPDPSELHSLAAFYRLGDGGYIQLLVEFGWMINDGDCHVGYSSGDTLAPLIGSPEPISDDVEESTNELLQEVREEIIEELTEDVRETLGDLADRITKLEQDDEFRDSPPA